MKALKIAGIVRTPNLEPGPRTFKVTARMTAELYPVLTNARRWNFGPDLAAAHRADHCTGHLKAPTVLWDQLYAATITMDCRARDPQAASEIVESIIRRTAEFTGKIRIHELRVLSITPHATGAMSTAP